MLQILHAGCGGGVLPPWFGTVEETRLDIDPGCRPHIVASISDLGAIGPYDVVFCSHAIEHLFAWQAAAALAEFRRVLRDGGYAVVLTPDLEGVQPTRDVLFEADAGPVTGHDLFYGFGPYVRETEHMMHRTGFVSCTLLAALQEAGFARCEVRRLGDYNLLGVGVR